MKSAIFTLSLGIALVVCMPRADARVPDKLRDDLWGEDVKAAVKAAKALGGMKNPEALALLMETLKLGAPTEECTRRGKCTPNLAVALVKAIGGHRSPKGIDLLESNLSHRDAKVRAAAMEAIGLIPGRGYGKRVVENVMRTLSDNDVQVRMAGANVIAGRKRNGLPLPQVGRLERSLIALLDRGDVAPPSIGLAAIGGYTTARHMAIHLKKIPEITIAKIYRSLLMRRDFGPEPVRQWIVRALAELKGQHATEALASYAASPPKPGLKSAAMANRFMER